MASLFRRRHGGEHEDALRPQNPPHFPECGERILHEFEPENERHEIDAGGAHRQGRGVCKDESRCPCRLAGFPVGRAKHAHGPVDTHDTPPSAGQLGRVVAGAAGQIEGPSRILADQGENRGLLEAVRQPASGRAVPSIVGLGAFFGNGRKRGHAGFLREAGSGWAPRDPTMRSGIAATRHRVGAGPAE
jgi:hypothetical protein